MIKILKSAFVIGIVGVFAFSATKAVWSDSGQSTGNTFQAGTLDLKLSNDGVAYDDNVTITWAGAAMTPGGAGTTATLYLQNVGDPAADHVHFSVVNTITPGAGVGATETDLITKHLQVTTLTYDGTDLINFNLIPDSNGNGYLDLADLKAAGQIGMSTGTLADNPPELVLDDLTPSSHPLVMTVALNSDSPDQNQGDLDTMDLTATLHQAEGQ